MCSSVSDCLLDTESALYRCQTAAPVVKLVKKSETLFKKLRDLFSNESILINGDDGTVIVVGQTTDVSNSFA